MIAPRAQWAIMIDVTNSCGMHCSNCTRMTAHARKLFYMSVQQFARALAAVQAFLTESEPDCEGRPKLIGIIGGEPTEHPEFEKLCEIMAGMIPLKSDRGLWTGVDMEATPHRRLICDTFGYINHNPHVQECRHQPVLVAIRDLITDHREMWNLIDRCWLQEKWSSAVTPKGFFFCEVAAAFDMIFDGPGGLSLHKGCWQHELNAYRQQIRRWCPRCGIPVPGLPRRRDCEQRDDLTVSNLVELDRLGSPRIVAGAYEVFDPQSYKPLEKPENWVPWQYLKEASHRV